MASYPHQLSGGAAPARDDRDGARQRADLLIADEPTTALDVTVQAQILKLLHDLQARHGMAMLFITHDLASCARSRPVCVMKQGKIVEHGEVEKVFSAPQHPYTRELIAAEPKGKPPAVNQAAEVMIRTDDLKVWFPVKRGVLRNVVGHIKAVDGVTVEVRKGETLGIVGESGSGKTTLGLAILRLIASQGPIVCHGRAVAGPQVQGNAAAPGATCRSCFRTPTVRCRRACPSPTSSRKGLWVHQPKLSAAEREGESRARTQGGRARCTDALPLSARIFRRAAPAHCRCARDRAGADVHRAGRATSALDMLIQAQIVDLLRSLQARKNLTYIFISHDLKVVSAWRAA